MCNWFTPNMCCQRVDQWSSGYQFHSQGGYCASPSCAGTEFFFNIVAEWSTQGTGYTHNVGEMLAGGAPFPRNRFAVETMLRNVGWDCRDLLDQLHNSTYALLGGPLTYSYAPKSFTRTTTSTTTTSTTSTSTTITTTTTVTTTESVTTTTSTTTTLPDGMAAVVRGAVLLDVVSPITFVTDPMVNFAVTEALAELARIPERWITVILRKTPKRWLQALLSGMRNNSRRLLKHGVSADYTMVVPAMNAERRTGAGAMIGIMNAPLENVTKVMRNKVMAAIGTNAGLECTGKTQPWFAVMEHFTTITTTVSFKIGAGKGLSSSALPRSSLHAVVTLSAMTLCLIHVATSRGS